MSFCCFCSAGIVAWCPYLGFDRSGVFLEVSFGEGKMKNRILSAGLVLAVLLAICVTSISAQNVTGTIQGTVSDSKGGFVPNVAVTITNADQKVVVRTEIG